MKRKINTEEVDGFIIELLNKSFLNVPTLINVIFAYNHDDNVNFLIVYNYCKANNISFTHLLKEYIIDGLLKRTESPSHKVTIIRFNIDIKHENWLYGYRSFLDIYVSSSLIRINYNHKSCYNIYLDSVNYVVTKPKDQDWIIKKTQKRFNHELSTFVNTIEKLCRCNKIDIHHGKNNRRKQRSIKAKNT